MRRVHAGSDDSVQATAGDAAAGKLSAASLGYFEDPFLEVLNESVGEPVRRLPPVMNRGKLMLAQTACCLKWLALLLWGSSSRPYDSVDSVRLLLLWIVPVRCVVAV